MAISTTSGAKIFIGPVTPLSAIDWSTDDSAAEDFEEISQWTEVKEAEDLGQSGDESAEVTFASVRDRRVRKLKGARNAGTLTLICGRDPLDEGQNAMIAAERTNFDYAFKIEYADAETQSHTDSVEYFIGKVMSRPVNRGTNDNVTRRNFAIGINSEIIEVLSELSS